jgi:hypothetical protein
MLQQPEPLIKDLYRLKIYRSGRGGKRPDRIAGSGCFSSLNR